MGKKKIIILLLLGIALLGAIFIPGYLRIRRLSRQNTELERQIGEMQRANELLAREHQRLVNDPLYLEEVAREKLGVARKGEIVYKVVPEKKR